LFLITSWSCFVGLNYETLGDVDFYALIFFSVLWLFSSVMFVVRAFLLYNQERSSLGYSINQLKKYYRDIRSGTDRYSIECKFTIDKIDEQEYDDTILFKGQRAREGDYISIDMKERENQLLRLGTFLTYGQVKG